MVRLMVSVSDELWLTGVGVGLVLLELAEPADVIVDEAVSKFPDRFDSSNAFNASCVNADGGDLDVIVGGDSLRDGKWNRGGGLEEVSPCSGHGFLLF